MHPPPAKKQKRLVVLSSDDDDQWVPPLEDTANGEAAKDQGSTVALKSETTNGTAAKGFLPSRPRTRVKDKKAQLDPSVAILSSPVRSPKKHTRKPKPTTKLPTSKPISSFFHAAANQSQQSNVQGRPKEETPVVGKEEEDLIEDDSPGEGQDVDEFRGLQDTTRFVLDRRKKSTLSTQNTTSTQGQKLSARSQRFKITGNATGEGADTSGLTRDAARDLDSRPWAERFAPKNLEELAVHRKKVSDIRNWLENVLQGRNPKRLLILKGPSGAGKTATMTTLAKAIDFELSEWRNPVGSEFSSEGYLSMSAQFEEFLGRSSKFNGLELTNGAGNESVAPAAAVAIDGKSPKRKVILLEEFPNTFLSTSHVLRSFRSSIVQYMAINTPSTGTLFSNHKGAIENITPLVMIISENHLTSTTAASDSFTAHRLLGADILSHPCVSIIEFNPIAPTLLTKALDLVIQKEARHSGRRRVPGPAALKRLGEVGDVRSAIGSLEFLCIRGEDCDDGGGKVASRAKKGGNASSALTKMEKESLEMVTQRESSLGLFHAVGKVVYNKRDDFNLHDHNGEPLPQPPDHMPEHVRLRTPQVSAHQLIDETGTDTSTFVAALHENYVMSCEGTSFTDALNGCLEALSDSDVISSSRCGRFGVFGGRSFQGTTSDSLRQDEISFQLAVRGLLFALPDPVKRRAHPIAGKSGGKNDTYKMFYPTSMRISRQTEETGGLVDAWSERLTRRNLQSTATSTPTTTEKQRTGLGCTKAELVLERLPYITRIEQRNSAAASTQLSQLEKITQFHGVAAPNDQVSDEDDVVVAKEWIIAEGKPESSVALKGVGQGGKQAGTPVLPVEEVGRLWLSDDDIVDD